jgi:hypothetical protein
MVEVIDPRNINDWIKIAKGLKMSWVESTERGDLNPTVYAERNGMVFCSVISPQLDKELGLEAAAMLRRGTAADTLTLIVDAHVYHGEKGESEEEFERSRPKNLQKACDDEGACEKGIISDCLVVHRITTNKKIQFANVPYYYHGKGTTFRWVNNPEGYQEQIMDEYEAGTVLEGIVPDALRKIMDLSSINNDPMINLVAEKLGLEDLDRRCYHTTRAVYRVLETKGFLVIDYLDHKKPWEGFKNNLDLVRQGKAFLTPTFYNLKNHGIK